jgi:hypothetical protein
VMEALRDERRYATTHSTLFIVWFTACTASLGGSLAAMPAKSGSCGIGDRVSGVYWFFQLVAQGMVYVPARVGVGRRFWSVLLGFSLVRHGWDGYIEGLFSCREF